MSLQLGFIGAGNVAWHLAPALAQSGNSIVQVISRSLSGAQRLADHLGCTASDSFSDLNGEIQVLFLTVPDQALPDIFQAIRDYTGIVVHTSGTFSMDGRSQGIRRYGGFYPLQTFTMGRPLDLSRIPVFIEGSDPEVTLTIRQLAEELTNQVYEASQDDRKWLHLAAVWANNFSNHMLAQSLRILQMRGQPVRLLEPLIRETYGKALEMGPQQAQTGPAIREDITTIGKHLEMLDEYPDLKELYRMISESIGIKKDY
jgi:predicted short-subunit dehydrogenase-like oxidoreductase (DUF2520 family)